MKKLIYTLLLLLVTFPAMAQSLFEQYERFLTEPRTYCMLSSGWKVENRW